MCTLFCVVPSLPFIVSAAANAMSGGPPKESLDRRLFEVFAAEGACQEFTNISTVGACQIQTQTKNREKPQQGRFAPTLFHFF